jgi:4-hydroxybenzoate polyprenyltransferase
MIRFATFKNLTRLEQSLFALPTVVAGTLLSFRLPSFHLKGALWVIPCFFLARISGMAFNQFIDRRFDAENERTRWRVLPTGRMTPKEAALIAWSALILFAICAFQINFTTALLTPVAVVLLGIYSYMKRVHPLCHFVLGAIHFLGPTMAYAATGNSLSPAALCLGGAAACLIIGTDIIYAIQDIAFDRQFELFSIPACLGIKRSLVISRLLHGCCLGFLWGMGRLASLPALFYGILPVMIALLLNFHLKVWNRYRSNDFTAIERTFFICNVGCSLSILFFILLTYL